MQSHHGIQYYIYIYGIGQGKHGITLFSHAGYVPLTLEYVNYSLWNPQTK